MTMLADRLLTSWLETFRDAGDSRACDRDRRPQSPEATFCPGPRSKQPRAQLSQVSLPSSRQSVMHSISSDMRGASAAARNSTRDDSDAQPASARANKATRIKRVIVIDT